MGKLKVVNDSRHSENRLTPVTLSGVVVPCELGFKLACSKAIEYSLEADPEWEEILATYVWEEVKVKGLLNLNNMTVVLQRVFPKGPSGDRGNIIDFATRKTRELMQKVNLNDCVLVPVAVLSVLNC